MATAKRSVEIFTAGCPICEETVNLVKSLTCPSCDVQIYDLREGYTMIECREKAARYGVVAVPAIAIDGALLECCLREPLTPDSLRAAAIGLA